MTPPLPRRSFLSRLTAGLATALGLSWGAKGVSAATTTINVTAWASDRCEAADLLDAVCLAIGDDPLLVRDLAS